MSEKRPVGRPPKEETVIARQAVAEHKAVKEGLIARTARRIRNSYDAAGMGRRLAGWMPRKTSPNSAIRGIETIRERSHDAARNDWAGASGVEKWTTTLVGIGITPRFTRIKDKDRKQQILDLFSDFVRECDADCVNNLYGLQTLAVRTWFDGGECFVRARWRDLSDGFAVPLQLQLLESEMVPLMDADTYEGLPQGNIIRSGIELNRRGKRVAFWVYKEHPGDGQTTYTGKELVRVLARDMLHIFEQKRPGQLRGVSASAPILARLRNVGDYEDATLERQKIANLFVAFIKRALPTLGAGDRDPLSGEVLDDDVASPPLAGLQPGLIQELDDGQEVQWSNPPEAGTNYSEYMRTTHLGTAAGYGLPYELFSGDIQNVSDRTLRVIINEFRRLAEQRQWQIVIPQMCQPVIDWFVQAAALAGKIGLDEADDVRRVEHAPHGWAYIHPVQDPAGKKLEVEAGFRSRSSVIGERGDDPDVVDAERAADKQREDDLNLTPEPPPADTNPTP